MRCTRLVRHARSHALVIGLWACVAACNGSGSPDVKAGGNGASPPAPPADVAVIEMDGVAGLSGLAADARGGLWAVPERKDVLIERPAQAGAPARAWPLMGAPDEGLDFESLAWLGTTPDGRERFAVGTEAMCERNAHAVLVAERAGDGFRVIETIRLALDLWPGTECEDGHGIEALCAVQGGEGAVYVVAAIEHPEIDAEERRYAPAAVLALEPSGQAGSWRPYRVALTSETGKLSALDCRLSPEGIEVWGIERHFETSRLVRFVVPRMGEAQRDMLVPTVVMDLSPYTSGGTRNFEGLSIVDGRVHALVDNQWRTITGPNEVLSLPLPGAP